MIRYTTLISKMMRLVAREALLYAEVQFTCNFIITFFTSDEGVVISKGLCDQYPETMTIVLHNQYKNLSVGKDGFSVTLNFKSVEECLSVPFNSLVSFYDRDANFSLEFKKEEEVEEDNLVLEKVKMKTQGHKSTESPIKKGRIIYIDEYLNKE